MAEVQSLRLLLSGLLAAVLVASLGANMLLYKELRAIQRANAELSEEFALNLKAFDETEAKRIGNMVNKLKVFAKTDPEFAKVLAKYLQPTDAPAPTVAPAPSK